MYKNQLQELAQRSCFNLPSYSCIREGPDHAPRFKATVNFNGEAFESPSFCSTLRLAEHAAAEVALNTLANRGPSKALAAKVLDETGVYKNLLQETAHRAGINLPVYTTVRSGPGHVPVFSCTVELAGMTISGEPSKTKKQAQKNAAMAAWGALKQMAQSQRKSSSSTPSSSPSPETEGSEEQEQVIIARILASLRPAESNFSTQNDQQNENPRSIPASRDPNLAPQSLYPTPYQNWAYSSFPTELAMYQLWQQAQLLQLQSRLLTLPVSPAPTNHVLQHMQPGFQPDHHLYYPTRDQEQIPVGPGLPIAALSPSLRVQEPIPPGHDVLNVAVNPSFYMQSKPITSPIREKPTVTIQEIKDEKAEEPPILRKAEALNPPLHDDGQTEMIVHEPIRGEEKKKNGGLEANIGGSGVPRSMNSGFRPVEFHANTQQNFDSYRSNFIPQHLPRVISQRLSRPPSAAVPVMIRTVGQSPTVGSRPQNFGYRMPTPTQMRTGVTQNSTVMEFGRVRTHFTAPAVQIRSVVPVCSSPPVRKIPNSNQVGESSKQEVKSKGTQDITADNSEVSKLKM
ncbi:Double-stranded RNA-binding protein [Actinidia chinensis var. chinensis]|uniref:Double-stranded RNA-binding protein n=1 Tax=Actinidia chinensis var. chinensis TaxID=1590841 RepID=A0A2R6RDS2_ACTCC|nr:Double-stranded RNA-binding protein [Actinidia chinensis var. chinensis]